MGEPVPILQLVRTLIKLSGKNEKQVLIQFTGLRQGEKLIEELFYQNEEVNPTSFPKIRRAHGPRQDWNNLKIKLEQLKATLCLEGPDRICTRLSEIVPEYHYLLEKGASGTHEREPLLHEPSTCCSASSLASVATRKSMAQISGRYAEIEHKLDPVSQR